MRFNRYAVHQSRASNDKAYVAALSMSHAVVRAWRRAMAMSDRYRDAARGEMQKNDEGKDAITRLAAGTTSCSNCTMKRMRAASWPPVKTLQRPLNIRPRKPLRKRSMK
jgi:hypothetical protein